MERGAGGAADLILDLIFFAGAVGVWLLATVAIQLDQGRLARARLAFWRESARGAGLSRIRGVRQHAHGLLRHAAGAAHGAR